MLRRGTAHLRIGTGRHERLSVEQRVCEVGDSNNVIIRTLEHTICHCQNNAVHRDILIDTIELSFVASQTPIPDRVTSLKKILGYNSHLPTKAPSDINAAVNSFFSGIKSLI